MHWKNAEEYQCYATWWSLASCSSTSPASGWTNSRPLQSLGPFQIGTSCAHMEVLWLYNHCIQMVQSSMNSKAFVLYCLLTLLFAFTVQILGFEKCEIVTADFYLLCADDPSFLIQCTSVPHFTGVSSASPLAHDTLCGNWQHYQCPETALGTRPIGSLPFSSDPHSLSAWPSHCLLLFIHSYQMLSLPALTCYLSGSCGLSLTPSIPKSDWAGKSLQQTSTS